MRNYFYYLRGCRKMGASPLPIWTFYKAYTLYNNHFYDAVDLDLETGAINVSRRYYPGVSWVQLRKLAKAVDIGKEVTHGAKSRSNSSPERPGGEPDLGAPGVREPVRPMTPTMSGASARTLPGSPAATWPDYDRSILY